MQATEIDTDPCVVHWRGRLKGWRDALADFKRFWYDCLSQQPQFQGMMPKDVVEWQINAAGRDRLVIRRLLQDYVNAKRYRYSTKLQKDTRISSFFAHNDAPLQKDIMFHYDADIPPVDGKLDRESLKRIILKSSPRDQCIWLMMVFGLMGEGEVQYCSSYHAERILQAVTNNEGIISITLPGRKAKRNKRNFTTFLDVSSKSDLGKALRHFIRISNHDLKAPLFKSNKGRGMTVSAMQKSFHSSAVECGVIKQFAPNCEACGGEMQRVRKRLEAKRKLVYRCLNCHVEVDAAVIKGKYMLEGVRYEAWPHQIRDLCRSLWREAGCKPQNAEFMMGHYRQVDPNEYDNPKYTPNDMIADYKKYLPYANILSQNPYVVSKVEVQAEVEELRRQREEDRRRLRLLEEALTEIHAKLTKDGE